MISNDERMLVFYPKVSDEWAIQMCSERYTLRPTPRVLRVKRRRWKVFINYEADEYEETDAGVSIVRRFKTEVATLLRILDNTNGEVHRVGYGKNSNLVLVYEPDGQEFESLEDDYEKQIVFD